MIKAFIFDIDGTLIDSNEAHAESFVRAFKRFGRDVSLEELKYLIGMGAGDILEKYLSEDEIGEFGEQLKEFRKEIFLQDFLPEIKTFPRLRELFEKIRSDGIKAVLASSAGGREIESYKKTLEISDLYEDETSADDAREAKPEPDIFLAAFKKLKNVDKNQVLVIGDTPYDARAAARADLRIIGVESGGWSRKKLLAEGCSQVFKDIEEIYVNYEKVKSLR